MATFISNFLLGIALTLPLGPVTLEILRRGLKYNFIESLKTFAGAFSAELTYFTIIYLGLIKLSGDSLISFCLGIFGVCFLLYLSYESLKDFFVKKKENANQDNLKGEKENKKHKNSFIAGYLITFLNPSNFFLWAGIIGGAFAQNNSLSVSSGVLLGVFSSLLAFPFFSLFGKKMLTKNEKAMKYVSLIAGLFLLFYGLKLAYNLFLAQ